MHYDPIKKILGQFFNINPQFRIFFYKLLDLLLLRAWYIKKEIRKWAVQVSVSKFHVSGEIEILDAGCGFGQYSYYLSTIDKSWKILGVDIWKEHIQECNDFFIKLKKDYITFKIADLTRFIEKEKFDLIITVDVMEHILEDEKVFYNFNRSLKVGGMLLISTPSDKGGSEAHSDDDKSFIEEHVRNGYNIDDIQVKLKNAGFRDIDANYSYGTPGHISWLLSMKIPMIILGLSKLFMILIPIYYILTFPFCLILNYIDVNFNHKSGTGLIVKAYK